MIGVLIQTGNARQAITQIRQAEQTGVPCVWAVSGRGADLLPIWAAAAVQTERIWLGTAIVRTWTRHPVGLAQEAMAFEELAPGRLRLGVGPASRQQVEEMYGGRYDKPMTYLKEYVTCLRGILHDGAIDFSGEYLTARYTIPDPPRTPVLVSAAGLRAYELAGEISDGALAWVMPKRYLVEQALPALLRGAEKTRRDPPPLVAHVPIAITDYAEMARALTRDQLGFYATRPHFTKTWAAAGFDPDAGYTDELLDDLLISGSEAQVAEGLAEWVGAGLREVMAHPILDPRDREGALSRCFAAVARANRLLS